MKMRSFIFYVVGLLVGTVMAPTVCPANNFCCLPFPLYSALEVGHSWTYLARYSQYFNPDLPAQVELDTLTVTVGERHQIGDQTYYELSIGGIYRVDDSGKTWEYDTETRSEKLLWDNLLELGPPADEVLRKQPWDRRVYYLDVDVEKVIVDGYACDSSCLYWISRYGPFGLDDLAWAGGGQIGGSWITNGGWNESTWRETLLDWGATHVYGLYMAFPEDHHYMIIAPDVAILYYAHWTDVSTLTYILQIDDQKATVVEDTSFGQLKQRMTRPVSDDP